MANRQPVFRICAFAVALGAAVMTGLAAPTPDNDPANQAACQALERIPNLTILSAELVAAKGDTPQYCHVTGLTGPAIHWHMQLPLPSNWNGRLLNIGNTGTAGTLVSADRRLAGGYAVANSNTGHDSGAEPNSSFAFNNRQAEIDFGYRAVHVTANASKTLVKSYYGKPQQYAYWEGCSQGGRQGLMEAQRFPDDFDGIVAGAPVINYVRGDAAHAWIMQLLMKDHFAGNLAYDVDGDGSFKSLTKLNLLREAVLAKCDAKDGVKDGILDDPQQCDFNPDVDLANKMCSGDKNADGCFTRLQLNTIKGLYAGPRDSKGNSVLQGLAYGSESSWPTAVIPHGGNKFFPSKLDHVYDYLNFLFYENDPGVPPSDVTNLSAALDKKAPFPEFAWWEFNIDDVTAGKGSFMMKILDAVDAELSPFLKRRNGKLLIYQGWSDADVHPGATVAYYKDVVAKTFNGDYRAAQEKARLFMAPGMGHCLGGPGPNDWDKLPPLVDWVENGKAPDSIVAVHRSNVRGGPAGSAPADNERKLCPFPQHAVYVGPPGAQDNPSNWVERNFVCK